MHALVSDPGGVPDTSPDKSAPRTAAFRRMHSVGFPLPLQRKTILLTTTQSISGLNTQPAPLIHPASYSHYWVCTWTSLPTCRLHFDQVGLEPWPALTHWVTLSNFIPPFRNPNDLGLTWHEHPFYEGLFVKPFFGVRGFVLAFRNIFESSEFGDAKHSRTEDDLQLDPVPCPILSMVLGCLVLWDVGLIWSCLPPSIRAAGW
jgi:hypothetical protein